MKNKTPKSIFPSPETEAEKLAEQIYYANPEPKDALATISIIAPIIATALEQRGAEEREATWNTVCGIARATLCTPFVEGDCPQCDARIEIVNRLEDARAAAIRETGESQNE